MVGFFNCPQSIHPPIPFSFISLQGSYDGNPPPLLGSAARKPKMCVTFKKGGVGGVTPLASYQPATISFSHVMPRGVSQECLPLLLPRKKKSKLPTPHFPIYPKKGRKFVPNRSGARMKSGKSWRRTFSPKKIQSEQDLKNISYFRELWS